MTLRELLKKKGIPYKVVSDALGVHSNNMPRYDNLLKRSIEEVIIISKATGIDISELIGYSISSEKQEKEISNEDRLLSIIESQQRTIENLSKK